MFAYLKGTILSADTSPVVLGVGSDSQGWVGYNVFVAQRPGDAVMLPGQKAEFHIYTHVREEAFDLYGFPSIEEREVFLTLLSVSGIGPKSALGILCRTSPGSLLDWISTDDSAALTRLPGIGKKTAERMVLELGDSVRKKMQAGAFGSIRPDRAGGSVKPSIGGGRVLTSREKAQMDACEALVGLGFREIDAVRVLAEILSQENAPDSAEGMIRLALRSSAV